MATPAEQRLLQLLDKWLNSLELHQKYAALDDHSYWQIQAWPAHERPGRWIVDLAKQRAVALKAQVEDRVKMGDAKFSDSLEMMIFLANLVGVQHIERFIPLADKDGERPVDLAPPDPSEMTATAHTEHLQNTAGSATGTREMPKFLVERPQLRKPELGEQAARAESGARAESLARGGPGGQTAAPAAEPAAPTEPSSESAAPSTATAAARDQVLADAERLVQWGRKWFELPELIARMADRPSLAEVRRILKDNRAALDKKIGRS